MADLQLIFARLNSGKNVSLASSALRASIAPHCKTYLAIWKLIIWILWHREFTCSTTRKVHEGPGETTRSENDILASVRLLCHEERSGSGGL